MTRQEYDQLFTKTHQAETCIACADGHAADANGYFCVRHFEEVQAMCVAENEARNEELARKRSKSARDGAETRRLADGTKVIDGRRVTPRVRNMARYNEIRSRIMAGRSW